MSLEFITGTEYTNKNGEIHRVDVTPDWQVWADQERRLDNLDALSAVMVAGFVANIDSVKSSNDIYVSSLEEYRRLVTGGISENLEALEKDIDTRVGTLFNQHFRKLYNPVNSVLKYNIFPLSFLLPKNIFLLSSNMTDGSHIASLIRNSQLPNSKITFSLKNLLSRGYIRDEDVILKESKLKKPASKIKPAESTTERLNSGMIEVTTTSKKRKNSLIQEEQSTQTSTNVTSIRTGEEQYTKVKEMRINKYTEMSDPKLYANDLYQAIVDLPTESCTNNRLIMGWLNTRGFSVRSSDIDKVIGIAIDRRLIRAKKNSHGLDSIDKIIYIRI